VGYGYESSGFGVFEYVGAGSAGEVDGELVLGFAGEHFYEVADGGACGDGEPAVGCYLSVGLLLYEVYAVGYGDSVLFALGFGESSCEGDGLEVDGPDYVDVFLGESDDGAELVVVDGLDDGGY